MIYEGEEQLQRLQADGHISPDDADAVRDFAAFLRDKPVLGTEEALRRHMPDDPTLAELDRIRETRRRPIVDQRVDVRGWN